MPYYARVNGQVEATNTIVIELIKKNIEDKPRRWHKTLNEVLWAMRNSNSRTTRITPHRLVYSKYAFLPLEISLALLRVVRQHSLDLEEYQQAMLMKLDSVDDDRFAALSKMEKNKIKMA